MRIEETIPLMISHDARKRLKGELVQLEIRIERLSEHMESEDGISATFSKIQLEAMEIYRMCLVERMRQTK